MSGPTPLDGGSLHVPARYTPILLELLREALRAGSPLPEVRQLFEACGVAAREHLAARVRAGSAAATPAVLSPAQTGPPSNREIATAEAAKRLGVTTQRVRQLCKVGRLPARTAARTWWISVEAIDAYLRERDRGV